MHSFDLLVAGDHRRLWQQLAPAGLAAGLAADGDSGGLLPYLQICRMGELAPAAGKRPGFIDHGIAGALLLLRLHDFVTDYSDRCARLLQECSDLAGEEQRQAVAEVSHRTAAARGTVIAAARAVALHNIVPGLPQQHTAAARGLTPERYRLRLAEQPLAFLLALADGLQDWDRPRFTAPQVPSDIGLVDQQVILTANEEQIHLAFTTGDSAATFRAWQQELGRCLDITGPPPLLVHGVADPVPQLADETGSEPPTPPATAEDWEPRPGTVLLGQWRIVRRLGRGGFGVVFAAEDLLHGRQVAVKLLDPVMAADQQLLARFRREVSLMRDLAHPRVVRVYDYREEGAQHLALITMEQVDGCSAGELLATARQRSGKVPVRLVRRIFAQILEALTAAHEAGVIHRDITPGNVLLAGGSADELLDDPDRDPRVKLADFGIAGLIGRGELSARSRLLGTAPYVAPEVLDLEAEIGSPSARPPAPERTPAHASAPVRR